MQENVNNKVKINSQLKYFYKRLAQNDGLRHVHLRRVGAVGWVLGQHKVKHVVVQLHLVHLGLCHSSCQLKVDHHQLVVVSLRIVPVQDVAQREIVVQHNRSGQGERSVLETSQSTLEQTELYVHAQTLKGAIEKLAVNNKKAPARPARPLKVPPSRVALENRGKPSVVSDCHGTFKEHAYRTATEVRQVVQTRHRRTIPTKFIREIVVVAHTVRVGRQLHRHPLTSVVSRNTRREHQSTRLDMEENGVTDGNGNAHSEVPGTKFETSDGQVFVLENRGRVVCACATLKNLIEDLGDTGTETSLIIPLPIIDGPTMKLVCDFQPKLEHNFDTLDQAQLFNLILAANYLNYPQLLDATTSVVAAMCKNKSPEEIRQTFNIKNDFTPEEEAEVRRENYWVV